MSTVLQTETIAGVEHAHDIPKALAWLAEALRQTSEAEELRWRRSLPVELVTNAWAALGNYYRCLNITPYADPIYATNWNTAYGAAPNQFVVFCPARTPVSGAVVRDTFVGMDRKNPRWRGAAGVYALARFGLARSGRVYQMLPSLDSTARVGQDATVTFWGNPYVQQFNMTGNDACSAPTSWSCAATAFTHRGADADPVYLAPALRESYYLARRIARALAAKQTVTYVSPVDGHETRTEEMERPPRALLEQALRAYGMPRASASDSPEVAQSEAALLRVPDPPAESPINRAGEAPPPAAPSFNDAIDPAMLVEFVRLMSVKDATGRPVRRITPNEWSALGAAGKRGYVLEAMAAQGVGGVRTAQAVASWVAGVDAFFGRCEPLPARFESPADRDAWIARNPDCGEPAAFVACVAPPGPFRDAGERQRWMLANPSCPAPDVTPCRIPTTPFRSETERQAWASRPENAGCTPPPVQACPPEPWFATRREMDLWLAANPGCVSRGVEAGEIVAVRQLDAPRVEGRADFGVAGVAGGTITLVLTVRNDGTTTWRASERYGVGMRTPPGTGADPADAMVPSARDINPGEQVELTVTARLPDAPGDLDTVWQLKRFGLYWFGTPRTIPVRVLSRDAACPAPPHPPRTESEQQHYLALNSGCPAPPAVVACPAPPGPFRREEDRAGWMAVNQGCDAPAVQACPAPPATFASEDERTAWLNANLGCDAPPYVPTGTTDGGITDGSGGGGLTRPDPAQVAAEIVRSFAGAGAAGTEAITRGCAAWATLPPESRASTLRNNPYVRDGGPAYGTAVGAAINDLCRATVQLDADPRRTPGQAAPPAGMSTTGKVATGAALVLGALAGWKLSG